MLMSGEVKWNSNMTGTGREKNIIQKNGKLVDLFLQPKRNLFVATLRYFCISIFFLFLSKQYFFILGEKELYEIHKAISCSEEMERKVFFSRHLRAINGKIPLAKSSQCRIKIQSKKREDDR